MPSLCRQVGQFLSPVSGLSKPRCDASSHPLVKLLVQEEKEAARERLRNRHSYRGKVIAVGHRRIYDPLITGRPHAQLPHLK